MDTSLQVNTKEMRVRKRATIEYWNNEKLQKQSDKNIYADYLKGVANGYFDIPVITGVCEMFSNSSAHYIK